MFTVRYSPKIAIFHFPFRSLQFVFQFNLKLLRKYNAQTILCVWYWILVAYAEIHNAYPLNTECWLLMQRKAEPNEQFNFGTEFPLSYYAHIALELTFVCEKYNMKYLNFRIATGKMAKTITKRIRINQPNPNPNPYPTYHEISHAFKWNKTKQNNYITVGE